MKHYSSRIALTLWLSAGAGCADMHSGTGAGDTLADKPAIASAGKAGQISPQEDQSSPHEEVDAPAATDIDESSSANPAVEPGAEAAAAPTTAANAVTLPPAPPVLFPAAQVVPMTTAPAQLPACKDALQVTGRLDAKSNAVAAGFGNWLADTYLFGAASQGTVSIWSSIQPVGDAYVYGYGFPFTVETLGESETPTLRPTRLAGMPLADDALDDGKARVDIQTEPGKRYLVTFKALIGSANQGSSWNYALSFCPTDLKLAGKLQQER